MARLSLEGARDPPPATISLNGSLHEFTREERERECPRCGAASKDAAGFIGAAGALRGRLETDLAAGFFSEESERRSASIRLMTFCGEGEEAGRLREGICAFFSRSFSASTVR